MVGGFGGTGKGAILLSNRSNQVGRDQGIQWKWQNVSQMNESRRSCPGMLLIGKGRVLVAGGGSRLAEILKLPLNDNDRGVWTRLTQPLTEYFNQTYLFMLNHRILAIGKRHIKQAILKICDGLKTCTISFKGRCKHCNELLSSTNSPLPVRI